MRPALLGLAALLCRADGFAVVGYIPDYRLGSVDWDVAVSSTTHLVLFSLQPTADGGLEGFDRLGSFLRPSSGLSEALARLPEERRPKLLVTVGGAGRSQHYLQVASNKKARKRLARRIGKLLQEQPRLAGVDLDWQAPESSEQWREFGRLAHEVRGALPEREERPLLTMTYHPRSGAVGVFSGMKGKRSEKGFVELFDLCHAMAYATFDNERRHSTAAMDQAAVDEWLRHGLPARKLTLGVPFFGIERSSGQARAYGELLAREPSLAERREVDNTKDGFYFVNAASMRQKLQLAARKGLAGVMIWELGQDASSASGGSLLRDIGEARESLDSAWNRFLAWIPFGEDQVIVGLAALLGAYFLKETLLRSPPGHAFAVKASQASQANKANKASQEKPEAAEARAEAEAAAKPEGEAG